MKICTRCKEEKPITEFYTSGRKRLHSHCKACSIKGVIESAKKYKERTNKQQRKSHLRTYNLVEQDYLDMLEKQQGCCAMCGVHHSKYKYRLSIDHNHTTGKVRSLLCVVCNTDVGRYETRKEEIEKYLKEYDSSNL
jgi:hypothetical protein